MNPQLASRITDVSVAKAQRFRNLSLFPLLAGDMARPAYILMMEAIEKNYAKVTEVSDDGSVPQLMVENDSDYLALILGGEELTGAKQNRVANTTILLDARSKTVIPVSCTERGRWHSMSHNLSHSKTVMSPRVRRKKMMSVSESLHKTMAYSSNQGEVWAAIDSLHDQAGTHSPTSAMKDAYDSRHNDLLDYTRRFEPVNGQCGTLAFIDGRPAGMDMFSTSKALKGNFGQLIKSYAMDALSSRERDEEASPGRKKAAKFMRRLHALEESDFESVGLGRDFRYEGDKAVGSALIADDTPIHASFFSQESVRNRKGKRKSWQHAGPGLFERATGNGDSQSSSENRDSDTMSDLLDKVFREINNELQKADKGTPSHESLQAIYRRMRDRRAGRGDGSVQHKSQDNKSAK